jgi:hypothetical protein
MRKFLLLGGFCLLMALSPPLALAEEAIGSIKNLKGNVQIVRGGNTLPAAAGELIYPNDTLKTADGGAIGLILRDDTLISMGPGSVLEVKEYLFEPKEPRYSMILSLLKGTFVYQSGVIGKLAPESIRLETPDSTIAVRGTRLLVKVS